MELSGLATAPATQQRLSLSSLLECMRPQQWVKNGFVLLPLVFSGRLWDTASQWKELTVLCAFCLAASSVYLWNDILDRKSDLRHPRKKSRPIPSGRLSVRSAGLASVALMAAGLALGFGVNVTTGVLLCAYIAINLFYGISLKHVVVMDLMCIALGFVLRVLAGATAIQVQASHWLLMCTFLLALTLSIFRRRQEALTLGNDSAHHRRVLSDYSIGWFDQAGTMLSAATIVAYALYTVSPETQARFGTDHLFYTLPFVVFGTLRYLFLVHSSDRAANPSSAVVADKQLLGCVIGWLIACAMVIYTR